MKMERLVFSDPKVIEASKQFVMIRIDWDGDVEGVVQNFGIPASPALLLLDPHGNLLWRVDGYADAASVLALMSRIPSNFEYIIEELIACERSPVEFEPLVAVGRFYAHAGLTEAAVRFYERARLTRDAHVDPNAQDEITLAIGRLLLRAGDFGRAQGFLEEAQKACRPPNEPRMLFALARAQELAGRMESSRKTYEHLITLSPASEEARLARLETCRMVAGHAPTLLPDPERVRKVPPELERTFFNPLVPPLPPLSETEWYERATSILEYSEDQLRARFLEELARLQPAPETAQLATILKSAGERVESLFNDFPNVLSREQVRQQTRTGFLKGYTTRDYSYLALVYSDKEGLELQEDRVDDNGKPVNLRRFDGSSAGAAFLSSGYAGFGLFFHPRHQHSSRFRLVGFDPSGSGNLVVAFAQVPGKLDLHGYFTSDGKRSRLLVQGLAWIDPVRHQIVRMGTELLAPRSDVGLQRQSTIVAFAETRLPGLARTLWLPREVTVDIEYKRTTCRNRHRYSDYQLFSVRSIEARPEVKRP
jgi:tetratricopeptide (TPR) repeat protein